MIYTAPRPPGLSNLGLPWRPEDEATLEGLVKAGLPARRIAEIMERSTVAIRAKVSARGWRLRGRRASKAKPPSGDAPK